MMDIPILKDIKEAEDSLFNEIITQCLYYRSNGMPLSQTMDYVLKQVYYITKAYQKTDDEILPQYKNNAKIEEYEKQ